MKYLIVCLSVMLCLGSSSLWGQSGGSNDPLKENIIERLIETISENAENEIDYTTFVEDLNYFYDHPINLNAADADDLRRLNLITELQIKNLQTYLSINGPLLSIYEINYIRGWDNEMVYMLLPFLEVAPVEEKKKTRLKSVWLYGKHELVARFYDVLEQQEGFRRNEEDPTDGYLGPSYQTFLRYRFRYKDKVSLGFTAEKDRGEDWFGGTQPQGFDFYSAHLFLRDVGIFRKIAIGDYQLQFGQGLTMWTGIGFRKTAYTMNIKRFAVGLRQYTATNQFTFNRGAAAEVRLGPVDVTAFISHKPIDGGIAQLDTLTGEALEFSSFLLSGLHRTESELSKKNALDETMFGGNVTWRAGKFNLGATAYSTQFSAPITPNDQIYNLYEFAGDKLFNAGVDYDLLLNKFYLFGEISMSDNGGLAMLQGMQASLHPNFSLAALYRNYAKNYQNLNSNAISDRFGTQNEEGLYIGFETTPIKYFKFQGYFDLFSYPWSRFGISTPSKGYEYLFQASFIPNNKLESYIRVRHQYRPDDDERDPITPETVQFGRTNYRFNFTFRVSRRLQLRNRLELIHQSRPDRPADEFGFLVYQDVVYKPSKFPVDFSGRVAFFQTDGFDTRVYTYENDVLYSFTVPGFSGEGMRTYLNAKWEISRSLTLWLRWSQTYFPDRTTVGSGLDEIQGNTRSDFKIQVRYRFRAAQFRKSNR